MLKCLSLVQPGVLLAIIENEAMVKVVQLLGTQGCHLCEVAERMVRRLAPQCGVQIQYLDIAEDNRLVDEYGMRIPVLRTEVKDSSKTNTELGWPFEEEEFIVWAKQLA